MIRTAMTYGTEFWSIKKQYMHKKEITEIRMLRWMCGKSRKDKIRNEQFREHLGVALVGNKIRETHLRWFRHIQCRQATTLVRKSLAMQVDGPPRGRGKGQRGCVQRW